MFIPKLPDTFAKKALLLFTVLFGLSAQSVFATQDVRVVGTVNVKAGAANPVHVTASIGDSANLDAFSRLRVSNPQILFEAVNVHTISDTMESTAAVNGSVVHIATASRVELRTSADSGSRTVLQSHGYVLYQPGKSQLVLLTGIFGSTQTNNIQRIGLFDDNDGLFFEQRSTGISVVRRSSVGGSVSNTAIPQASWNIDPMNGSGPSGYTIDFNKAQIYIIDFQWLGVGRVRLGLDVDGVVYYVHEFLHANSVSDVYMLSANLPVRYESVNSGASTATKLNAICSAVISEGGVEEAAGIIFSTSSVTTTVSAATSGTAILALSPIDNTRNFILPTDIEMLAAGNVYWELVFNGTLSGGTWARVGTSSVEANLGATYTAGTGKVLLAGYIGTGGGVSRSLGSAVLPPARGRFANDIAGTTGDTLTLVMYSFTGTPAISASIEWIERR